MTHPQLLLTHQNHATLAYRILKSIVFHSLKIYLKSWHKVCFIYKQTKSSLNFNFVAPKSKEVKT